MVASTTPTDFEPQGRKGEDYRSLRILARGGMGVVELALRRTGDFQRLYAVKRLLPVYRQDDDFRRMFVEEARIAGLIRHPNVVSVLDVGEDMRGPYLVMDFVEGLNAGTLIQKLRANTQRVPMQVACRIIAAAAAGLCAAHELRDHKGNPLHLVHRDISPANVLLGFDGSVRLTDFGIAKAMGRKTRTTTGLLKGKVGYMSPEQLQFEEPDQRSDLFSLGVVFFELLSKQRLFDGESSFAIAKQVLSRPTPDLFEYRRDAHPAVVELLFELLAKSPEHRPDSASSVASRLNTIIDEFVVSEGTLETRAFMQTSFQAEMTEARAEIERLLQGTTAKVAIGTTDDARVTGAVQLQHPIWSWRKTAPALALVIAIAVLILFAVSKSLPTFDSTDAIGPSELVSATPPPPTHDDNSADDSGEPITPLAPDEPRSNEPQIVEVPTTEVSAKAKRKPARDKRSVARPARRSKRLPRSSEEDKRSNSARLRASDHAVAF